MRKATDYIQDYQQNLSKQKEEQESIKNAHIARGMDHARAYIARWLGECWGSILQEKEMRANFSDHNGTVGIGIYVDIVYASDQGEIDGRLSFSLLFEGSKCAVNQRDTPQIEFGSFRSLEGQNVTANLWITKSVLSDERIKDDELGLLFWKLEEMIKVQRKTAEERRQAGLDRALNFERFEIIASADTAYNERVREFPEFRNEIKAAFDRRVAEIQEDARKEREWEQEQARLAARRELLSAYAARAWEENVFLGYEIQYGLPVENHDPEESPIYTESIFSLESMPAPDGFFTAYRNDETFRFRPQRILGIREIKIQSAKDSPYPFRRYVEITDGEVSETCAFPPAAIFTIDPVFLPKNHEK